ncbi:OsmC family peroxiredoxin [Rubrobacter tropicus]|uniref:OsmC family peroxiredoxin n=1 Tax=Rubrobacter tropicus TaxID=2653851 RepID=UPI001A9E2E14|nr:OsmC family peroxiredoxin [Rubrobacter tropicus]
MERRVRVEWEGSLADGGGPLSLGSNGILRGSPVTWASCVERSDGKTSPEELVAAAHASCYAMALSLTLSEKGSDPERPAVGATCVLDGEEVGITTADLEGRGAVPGLGAEEFRKMAEEAEKLCPVSNALKGNVEMGPDARLA